MVLPGAVSHVPALVIEAVGSSVLLIHILTSIGSDLRPDIAHLTSWCYVNIAKPKKPRLELEMCYDPEAIGIHELVTTLQH